MPSPSNMLGESNPETFWNRHEQSAIDRERMMRDMINSQYQDPYTSYENYVNPFNRYLYPSESHTEEQKNKVGVAVLKKIKAVAHAFTANEEVGNKTMSKADEFRALGLEHLADVMDKKAIKILKEIAISAAGYKRINRSELDAFQKELAAVSDMTSKRKLEETLLKYYVGQGKADGDVVEEKDLAAPPAEVLVELGKAKTSKLFDDFAVLHIKYVPDPILCGKINESEDLFFIAEWGDDVKLSDIVKE